jgi:uncharacterized RmlC-like cupin family protein
MGTVFAVEGFDLCRTRLSPDASSGWHHHGGHTVYGTVLDGRARLEFGPGKADAFEVGPGDFFLIPAAVVHREASDEEAQVALVGYAGEGPLVVDADPPERLPAVRPRVAGDADLVPTGMLKGLARLTPFPDAAVQQVRGHAAGAVESNWHHHGDNHVFGYVVEGEGYMEWGTGPGDRALVRTGECFHLPPGVVHRDVNPHDADQRYLLWLTGSEPRTVPVEGPPEA